MASSAESCSPQSLTMGQAIGVGVVAGFVGAVVLVVVTPYLFIHGRSFINTILLHPKTSSPHEPSSDQESAPVQKVTFAGPPISAQASVPDTPDLPFITPHREKLFPEPPAIRIPIRVDPQRSPKQISNIVGFEYGITAIVSSFIIGVRDPPDRGKPIQESIFDENQLIRLAGEPANGDTWSGFISNPDTRALAIVCFLSRVLYKRMNPREHVDECLLAPEITACYRLMTEHICNGQDGDETVAIWREAVYLAKYISYNIRPPRSSGFGDDDPRAERTYAMVPAIAEALKLEELKLDQYPDDMATVFNSVFEEAANSAVILFGHPCEWQAVWESDAPGIVVFPEIRFTWQGTVMYRRPARTESEFYW